MFENPVRWNVISDEQSPGVTKHETLATSRENIKEAMKSERTSPNHGARVNEETQKFTAHFDAALIRPAYKWQGDCNTGTQNKARKENGNAIGVGSDNAERTKGTKGDKWLHACMWLALSSRQVNSPVS